MQKNCAVFENCLFPGRLERRFYFWCLLRQPSLAAYLPLYLLIEAASYFFLIPQKKYLELHWSFLKKVRDLPGKLEKYGTSRKIQLPAGDMTVLSAHPLCVVGRLTGCETDANDYDPESGKFRSFRKVKEMAPEGCTAYGTALSPIMRQADRRVWMDGKRLYTGFFPYFAGTLQKFIAAFAAMGLCCVIWTLIGLYFASQTCASPMVLFKAYFTIPRLVLFNLLPVCVLCGCAYLLTNSAAGACLISGTLSVLIALINYYKIAFRDDPLVFEDIYNIREGAQMTGRYQIMLTPKKLLLFAVILLAAAAIRLFFDARIRVRFVRPALFGLLLLCFSFCLQRYYFVPGQYDGERVAIFQTVNKSVDWSLVRDTTRYTAHGLYYPLVYSYYSYDVSTVKPPEGYDENEAAALLSSWKDENIPEDRRVNVIGLMLESYADFSRFDKEMDFTFNPYEYLNQLRAESFSGDLLVDIFGANTIVSERSFVTGLGASYLSSFRTKTNSYAWYFGDQGYTVEGGHPGYNWFYNRQNVNQSLGFDRYYFDDDTYAELSGQRNCRNDVFFPHIADLFEKAAENGEDYFSFNVSYEGHGPYSDTETNFAREYVPRGNMTAAEYNAVNNYMELIYDTTVQLERLVDRLRQSEEPVILVLFGDHKPNLGDNSSAYRSLGISLNTETEEGFLNYYTTPYLIWANGAAKARCQNNFTGKGPTLSPSLLMNQVFQLAGWKGDSFAQYTADFMEKTGITAIHQQNRYVKDGKLITALSEDDARAVSEWKQVQYYRRSRFKQANHE